MTANEPDPQPALSSLVGAGDRISHYKLLQEIGEGGAGVVYLAEQEEPIRRRVALKIVKLGMDTRQVVARFEAERQALALMDHPNIARVFDAGATDSGRPYFVMELVTGSKITDYCDQHRLSMRQRLELFIPICQAVHHAHQKGIVHRDLKPSNVLITEHEGVAIPKIIDFGIAKATTGQPLTDKTLFTAVEQFIGTPAYMSPEQAGLGQLDIDHRSDIYSLGVLLYEVLTSQPPFDKQSLAKAAWAEILRTIRETDSQAPSARMTSLSERDRANVAQCRRANPQKLSSFFRGDIDWILLKALEKDRRRRYQNASGLADDIGRYLEHEPVAARPPGRIYRFQKTIRRHKRAVAAICVATAALLFGVLAGDRAEASRRQKEKNASAAQAAEAARTKVEIERILTKADIVFRNGETSEAERLVNQIPGSSLGPNSALASLRRQIGNWYAHKFQSSQAASNYSGLLEVNCFDGWANRSLDCLLCASAVIEAGDLAAYEKFRTETTPQYIGTTDARIAQRISRAALLGPADREFTGTVGPLYDLMAASIDTTPVRWDESWYCLALALTDYRRGHYSRAEEWCRLSLAFKNVNAGDWLGPAGVTLMAMIHHQMNRIDQAQFELAYARPPIDSIASKERRPALVSSTAVEWVNFITAHILLQEADALIGAVPSDVSSNAMAARDGFLNASKLDAVNQFDAEEKVVSEIPPLALQLEGGDGGALLWNLGYGQLTQHEWTKAETNWTRIIYGPDRSGALHAGQGLSGVYLSYGPLLVQLGDTNAYEKFKATALTTYDGTRDTLDAARILRSCLLAPASAGELVKFSQISKALANEADSATNFCTEALWLLEYRQGNFLSLSQHLKQHPPPPGFGDFSTAEYHVLSALAYGGLGQRDSARAELAGCADIIEEKFDGGRVALSGQGDPGIWDWWMDHFLLVEAKKLLDAGSVQR